MRSQGRKDQPGVAEQQGDVRDCEQAGAANADDPCDASFDYMDEAIEESMDASDPPAYTPQTAIGPPGHADAGEPAGRD